MANVFIGKEIIGDEAFKKIYERALKTGEARISRARFVIVGQDGVGKTCLVNSLLKKVFHPCASTDGVACTLVMRNVIDWIEVKCDDDKHGHYLDSSIHGTTGSMQSNFEKDPVSATDVISEPQLAVESSRKHRRKVEERSAIESDVEPVQIDSDELLRDDVDKLTPSQRRELRRFMNDPGESESKKDQLIINVWDHGGQECYLMAHAALLGDYSEFASGVYAIVFNQALRLADKAVSTYRKDGCAPEEGETQELAYIESNEDFILYWISSIQIAHPDEENDSETQAYMGSSLGVNFPPVMLIGTNDDAKAFASQNKSENNKRLEAVFRTKSYQSHLIRPQNDTLFFPIDNTKSGSADEDPAIDIRSTIEKICKDYWADKPAPVRWLRLEKLCNRVRDKEKKHLLTKRELYSYGRSMCGITSDNEMAGALLYLSSLGVILFYENVPELEQTIFIDPEWLVRVVCSFVTAEKPPQRLIAEWQIAKDTGVVDKRLARHFLDRVRVDKCHHNLIFTILGYFDIVYSGQDHKRNGSYIVPSLVQKKMTIAQLKEVSGEQSFLVFAPRGLDCFPEPLFFRLVVRCLRHYVCENEERARNWYLFHSYWFKFVLFYWKKKYVLVSVREVQDCDFSTLNAECVKLRAFLTKQLEEARKLGMKGFKFDVCAESKDSIGDSIEKSTYVCIDDCVLKSDVERAKIWMQAKVCFVLCSLLLYLPAKQ